MPIFDLFSKRRRRERGEVPDVYTYDNIPEPLRVQIVHIWTDAIGDDSNFHQRNDVYSVYEFIVDALCREYGVFTLSSTGRSERHYLSELSNFFLKEEEYERVLDTIELSFFAIDCFTRKSGYLGRRDASVIADSAIQELNDRMKEHGVGYQYAENKIVRIDSQLLHAEAVKPALTLLSSKHYSGPQQEFLKAYEHYRHNRFKEALNEALKAFESTMKAICDKRGWGYDPNAPSKKLVDICFSNGLIPSFWQSNMGGLRSLLEAASRLSAINSAATVKGLNQPQFPSTLLLTCCI